MIIERRLSPNYSWALATHRQTANLETPRWQSHRGKSHERKMTGDAVVMFTITQAHRVLARVKQRCEHRPSLFLLCTRLSFTVQHTVRFSVQQRVVFQAQFHHVKLHNSLSISRFWLYSPPHASFAASKASAAELAQFYHHWPQTHRPVGSISLKHKPHTMGEIKK